MSYVALKRHVLVAQQVACHELGLSKCTVVSHSGGVAGGGAGSLRVIHAPQGGDETPSDTTSEQSDQLEDMGWVDCPDQGTEFLRIFVKLLRISFFTLLSWS